MNKISNRILLVAIMLLCTSAPAYAACQIFYDTRWASGAALLFWLSWPATILFLLYCHFFRKKIGRKRFLVFFVPPAFFALALLVSSYGIYKASPPCPKGAWFDTEICSCVMKVSPEKPPAAMPKPVMRPQKTLDETGGLLESVRKEYAREAFLKKEYIKNAGIVFALWFLAGIFLAFMDARRR